MSISVSLFFLVSALLVFYNTYIHLWFQIIKIFEPTKFNSKYADIKDDDLNSSSFVKLISSDELSISNQRIIDLLKKFSRIAFSTSITTSFLVIEFILYHFISDGENQDNHTALNLWNLNLVVITINLIVIHPILITVLLVNKFFKSTLLNNLTIKSIATLIIFIFWCITLSKFDSFTDLNIVDNTDSHIIAYYLLRISVIGITLIAALNGVGSFSTAYYNLFKRSNSTSSFQQSTPQYLETLEKTLQNTSNMIKSKEIEYEIQQSSRPYADDSQLNKRPGFQPKKSFLDLNTLNQTLNPFKSNKSKVENELISEINSLKIIKNDIYLKMLKVERNINQPTTQDKFHAKIRKIIQLSLSIYCTFKILQVTSIKIISIFNSKFYDEVSTKESDPLVLTIVKTIQIFITIKDEEFITNQLSFIVSGALFLCSINGVFMTFQHLYRFLPLDLSKLSKTTTPNTKYQSVSIIKNLSISELTGIYTLATILILKSNLTSNFSSKLNTLFSLTNQNISIVQLDNWFDKIFLVSVVLTAVCIKTAEYLSDDIDGFEDQALAGKIV